MLWLLHNKILVVPRKWMDTPLSSRASWGRPKNHVPGQALKPDEPKPADKPASVNSLAARTLAVIRIGTGSESLGRQGDSLRTPPR